MAKKVKTPEEIELENQKKAEAKAKKDAAKKSDKIEKTSSVKTEVESEDQESEINPNQTTIPGTEDVKDDSLNTSTPEIKENPKKAQKAEAKEPVTIVVKSLVNMINNDGTSMVIGKMCKLSKSEHARLKKDARGPFFEELED